MLIATSLVVFVALQHIAFMVLEMGFWTHPIGRAVFRTTESFAGESRVLAANQGLYNGFLAFGLILGLWLGNQALVIYLLGCVIAAGIFAAITVSRRVFFIQAVPALLALFWSL